MREQTIELFGAQCDFVDSDADEKALCGGVGSGKSYAGAVATYLEILEQPGIVWLVTAPTYTILKDATVRTYLEVIPEDLIADFNRADLNLRLVNGSEVLFRSAHNPERLVALNVGGWHCDEAALISEDAFKRGLGRVRQPGYRTKIFLTTTPRGFNWFQRYVAGWPVGKKLFYASSLDNPHTPPVYKERLLQVYRGEFLKQEVYGQFVFAEGLVYPEFQPAVHLADCPFNEQRPVELAIDFGFSLSPTAVLAIQQDGFGNVFVIDEIYATGRLDEDIVAELRGKPYWGRITAVVCDPEAPDRIERLRRLGLPARPAERTKIGDGIAAVRSLLAARPGEGVPFIRFDRERVQMLPIEMGQYRYAEPRVVGGVERNVSAEPIDAYNHTLDALRYWVMSRHRPALALEAPPPTRRVMVFQRLGRR